MFDGAFIWSGLRGLINPSVVCLSSWTCAATFFFHAAGEQHSRAGVRLRVGRQLPDKIQGGTGPAFFVTSRGPETFHFLKKQFGARRPTC